MAARVMIVIAVAVALGGCSTVKPDGILKGLVEGDVTAGNPPKLPAETTQVKAPPRTPGILRMKIEF